MKSGGTWSSSIPSPSPSYFQLSNPVAGSFVDTTPPLSAPTDAETISTSIGNRMQRQFVR